MQRITGLEPRATMARKINEILIGFEKRISDLEEALAEKTSSTAKKAAKKTEDSDKSE